MEISMSQDTNHSIPDIIENLLAICFTEARLPIRIVLDQTAMYTWLMSYDIPPHRGFVGHWGEYKGIPLWVQERTDILVELLAYPNHIYRRVK